MHYLNIQTMGENQSSLNPRNKGSAPGSKCSTPVDTIPTQGSFFGTPDDDDQCDQGIVYDTPKEERDLGIGDSGEGSPDRTEEGEEVWTFQ